MIKQYELKRDFNTDGKVYIGIPRERLYIPAFVDNRDQILTELNKVGQTCGYFQADGHRVDRNRDRIVEAFLDHPDKPEWLQMLDSDMDHPRDTPIRLAKWGKPIIGGLYFSRNTHHDPFVFKEVEPREDKYGRKVKMWAPMREEVFDFLNANKVPMVDGALTIDDPEGTPLVECDAIATGSMLLHRSVLETMAMPIFEYREHATSEDMQFCYEAKHDYGIPIFCDLSTISGHYIWSPVGQAQFRMIFQKRGLTFAAYTKREAADMLAKFWDVPSDEAMATLDAGSASMVGDYWKGKFGKRTPTAEEVDAFYKDDYTGRLYLVELIHWNFSRSFHNIKSLFLNVRKQKVLEIGTGIGSLAIQLSVQGCDVTTAEINDTLIEFSKMRLADLKKDIATEMGRVRFVKDRWVDHPEKSFDTVVSVDTFEHMPEESVRQTLKDISHVLKPGGDLIYHATFGQQDLYPMHYDHSEMWDTWMIEAGLIPVSPTHAIKGK